MVMQSFENILFKVKSNHAELTLNRPSRLNAMDYATLADMNRAIEVTADEPEIRALVIRGAGRSFCAGDDIKSMGTPPRPVDDLFRRSREVGYVTVLRNLRNLHKPVIAAVHGYALGAGLDLALAADIRILSRDAQVGMPYSKLGYAAGSYLLPRVVGPTKAIDMLFTARQVSAEEALACGIATELVDSPEDLDAAVERWAELLRQRPTRTLGYMKQAVNRSFENDFEDAYELLSMHRVLISQTEDFVEGKAAWLEKREAQFKGR